eukprot:jgi/Psemu1/49435/gm1.49435_g
MKDDGPQQQERLYCNSAVGLIVYHASNSSKDQSSGQSNKGVRKAVCSQPKTCLAVPYWSYNKRLTFELQDLWCCKVVHQAIILALSSDCKSFFIAGVVELIASLTYFQKAAKLAKSLYEAGHQFLEEPFLPHKSNALTDPIGKKEPAAEASDSGSESEPELEGHQSEPESSSDEEIPPMPARTPNKTPSKKSRHKDDVDQLAEHLKCLKMHGPVREQPIAGTLNYCMLSARWEDFDFEKGRDEGYALMRMLIQNGTSKKDFKFEWKSPRVFEIKLVWPLFMRKALLQTGLDVTSHRRVVKRSVDDMVDSDDRTVTGGGVAFETVEVETYPKTHDAMKSFGRNAVKMERHYEDRRIRSIGLFHFDYDMDTKFDVKFFKVTVDDDGNTARILQILFKEAIDDEDNKESTYIEEAVGSVQYCKLNYFAPDPPAPLATPETFKQPKSVQSAPDPVASAPIAVPRSPVEGNSPLRGRSLLRSRSMDGSHRRGRRSVTWKTPPSPRQRSRSRKRDDQQSQPSSQPIKVMKSNSLTNVVSAPPSLPEQEDQQQPLYGPFVFEDPDSELNPIQTLMEAKAFLDELDDYLNGSQH